MNQQFYLGVVENRIGDPLKLGRIQVRVFGVHTELLSDVPTSSLPWAVPLMPATSASISGIGESVTGYVEGTTVFVFFLDGDSKQQPIIIGSAHGIPQTKSAFSNSVDYESESFQLGETVTTPATTTPASNVVSSDGTPVVSSSGEPVQTGTTTPPTSGLDISKMVAQFGANVTIVYQTLKDFGITDNFAIVAILSNIAKESSFVPVREKMGYSSIARLKEIFKSKFPSLESPEKEKEAYSKYLNNSEALSNLVYSNSDGNGNVNTGDGYKYRGGGFIHLTKKNNYKAVGSAIGVDLVTNPDLILSPAVGAKAVAQYFVNRFGGAKKLTFSSLDDALQTVTKKVNPGGFANDYPKVVKFSKLCVIDGTAPEVVEKEKEKEKEKEILSPNDPTNDIDHNATREQINSGKTSKTVEVSALGFKDPNGKFPLSATLKEPDTNRLVRTITAATAVEVKRKNRRSSIKTIGGTFAEPLPAYNAKYPYNHVYSTESGHLSEFDDTAGSERIHTYHKSGTYSEIDMYGNRVNKIMGDDFTIVERNGYIYIDGTARITIGSDVKLSVAGDLDIEVDGNLSYNIGGDATFKVGGTMKCGVGSNMSVQAGGNINMDGALINLNSGASETVSPEARTGTSNDYPPRIPESAVGSASTVIEDSDSASVEKHIEKEIAAGNITKKEIDDGKAKTPEKVDETPPATTPPLIPASCEMFANKTDIPDSTQISKNYTIGMLSTKAAASSAKITAQHSLSVAQIACNLKKVAENCLDIIKAKYPKMLVTSGFRYTKNGSQHEKGQAIDMQFGVPNSEYFEIATWIKDNVPFDQLLLEYKTIESGKAWIHISMSDTPRKVVYTYMNHKNKGTGLRKLQ